MENENEKSKNGNNSRQKKKYSQGRYSALELHFLLPSRSSRRSSQVLAFLDLDFLDLHDPLAAHLLDLRYQSVALVESGDVVAAAY